MNLFVLSELQPSNLHVAWATFHDLEDILTETFNPTFIYPQANDRISVLKRYRHRIFKSWFKVNDLPNLGNGPNILFMNGMNQDFLLAMPALGNLLKKFDYRLVYLQDAFEPAFIDRSVVGSIDCLFTPIAELADDIYSVHKIRTSFFPLGCDVLKYGTCQPNRFIDVISYGRTQSTVHQCLTLLLNKPDSNYLYHHTTQAGALVHNTREHRQLFWKMLTRAKINLCFEASDIPRFRGTSPILLRWFESFTAGCVVIGTTPFGKGVAPLIDWEDSTIDIPKNPLDFPDFFEYWMNDSERIQTISQRNYFEALRRHDWRYRLRDMFQLLDLPISDALKASIERLQKKADEVYTSSQFVA